MSKNNANRRRVDAVSLQARHLTPGEIRIARLNMAQEMVTLVFGDVGSQPLPVPMQDGLRSAALLLDEVLLLARGLP